MKSFLFLAISEIVAGAVISPLNACQKAQYAGPTNPSFETGTLEGWEILGGNAFGNASVSSDATFWGGPFNQEGTFFIWGFANAGDPPVGQLRSTSFQSSSYLSFLISGGYDPVNLYVGLVRDQDGQVLLKQTGMNDEAFVRIVWDTSAWAGQSVHVLIYDNSTASSWGHINVDDVRTGCEALQDDNGLAFNVLGQVNQPSVESLPTCSLYAADPLRPQYHYTPYQGWINDPAGLVQFNGQHHLFSQFYPSSPFWGPMHWSHAMSPDAVHWRNLPVALYPPYPNNSADTSGRWTGSAVVDASLGHKGGIRLIFTDFTDLASHPNAVEEVVSTATSSDGQTFSLYAQNPIIGNTPPNSASGFRDPKIFKDPTDDVWKLVVGSGDSVSGKVHLYRSEDLVSWTYIGVLYEGNGSTGTMWECPNFFPLGGKWVLFYGGNSLGWYEVGTYNGTSFTSEKTGLLDAGPDTYATQWYLDETGRNLAITWMGNWGTYKWPSRVNGWAGQQSVTRELFIRTDGGLGSRPIPEIQTLAGGRPTTMQNQAIRDTIAVGSTNIARLQVTVDLGSSSASGFTIDLFSSAAETVVVTYEMATKTLTLDTTKAGYGQAGTWDTQLTVANNGKLSLDLLIDRSSLEVFADDGTAMTVTVWPKYEVSTDIKIAPIGGVAMIDSIVLTPFGSSWC